MNKRKSYRRLTLYEKGHEVFAIDKNPKPVQKIDEGAKYDWSRRFSKWPGSFTD